MLPCCRWTIRRAAGNWACCDRRTLVTAYTPCPTPSAAPRIRGTRHIPGWLTSWRRTRSAMSFMAVPANTNGGSGDFFWPSSCPSCFAVWEAHESPNILQDVTGSVISSPATWPKRRGKNQTVAALGGACFSLPSRPEGRPPSSALHCLYATTHALPSACPCCGTTVLRPSLPGFSLRERPGDSQCAAPRNQHPRRRHRQELAQPPAQSRDGLHT